MASRMSGLGKMNKVIGKISACCKLSFSDNLRSALRISVLALIAMQLSACAKSTLTAETEAGITEPQSKISLAALKFPKMQTPLLDVDVTSSLSGEIVKGDYITAYSRIALGLRQCWMGETQPLENSKFFARNNVDGEEKKSDIYVHQPAEHPKRGPRIFSVHLKPRSTGTEVRMDNRLLEPKIERYITKDIRRWIGGGEGCGQYNDLALVKDIPAPASADRNGITAKIPAPKKK